ncbi:RICIN domain-containing protein [Micromonospora sp. CPCC 205371]|nr:RICIN domain-containing protein [Micromonospora sp. CPCC 205371]
MTILKRLSAIALGMVVLATMLVVTPGAASAAVPFGWYRIRSVAYPNECMAVNANYTIYSLACGTSASEKWYFGPVSTAYPAHYRELRNSNGRCMDADNRGGRLTTRMHTYYCNGSRNQAWLYGDPNTVSVGCVWVANLCDWRPMNVKSYVQIDDFTWIWVETLTLQPTTSNTSITQWVVEPTTAP